MTRNPFLYMSNKVSNHLFELIKSLTKSEKRYFKLFSSRHTIGEENGYLKLFDFIDQMDSYQEDLIYMHFKGQALLNKFSITKFLWIYLKQLILIVIKIKFHMNKN